ncbi:precorrin-2 dehydrogenase/sirohydrochlorin ferrochelatase family protein [Candidatus Phycosocius spiralis]|nr:NAD(P)-dependent oxidoreductase [Candidatus Phycosocius spiralis]
MIPIHLDPSKISIGLAGRGDLALRRLAWLRNLGATPVVFSDAPSDALHLLAGTALLKRLPNDQDLDSLNLLWIADLTDGAASALGIAARAKKVLLNTEDVLDLCDFHTPAIVQRGRLVLSAGTGGASPAAASYVRERLAAVFPEPWCDVLDELALARQSQKMVNASLAELRNAALTTLETRFGKSDAVCVNFACGTNKKLTQPLI